MFRHIPDLSIDDFGLRWLFHLYFGRTEHYGYFWRLIGSCDSRPHSLCSWLWTRSHGMRDNVYTKKAQTDPEQIWSPMSEIPQIGRNPIYLATLAVFVAFQAPTALASNFGMLLAFRFLTGFFGSPVLATGGA